MYYCVVYDISNNRLRRFASKWCRQAGLERLQRSVFTGVSDPSRIAELESRLRPILPHTDQFAIIPLDKNTYFDLIRNSRLPAAAVIDKKVVVWKF